MKVFVTGATGFIGTAVVSELRQAGHNVVGLARSDEAAAKLVAAGAEAHRGSLQDDRSLAAGVQACDGVIHLAHDMGEGSLADSMDLDRKGIAALVKALTGSGKVLVGTTGIMLMTPGRISTENDASDPASPAGFRVPSENDVLAAAEQDVRACVVRLAPSVHGEGDAKGFARIFTDLARRTGRSAYVGEGGNCWTAVHRSDAARLFRLAMERGEPGARYHGAAEVALPFREIAEAIGVSLELPVVSLAGREADEHFGWLRDGVATDNPTSNAITRDTLGWEPTGPGLLEDIRAGFYL